RSLFSAPSRPAPRATLFPYTPLFRSLGLGSGESSGRVVPFSAVDSSIDTSREARFRRNHMRASLMAIRVSHVENAEFPSNCRKRSEEHTSELQSRGHLVCRLLLEKKK